MSLTDTLPAGMTATAYSSPDATCDISGGDEVTCDFGTLAAGATGSVTVTVMTDPENGGFASRELTNSATPSFIYTITVSNHAAGSTAHDVRVVDTLDPNTTYVSGTATSGSGITTEYSADGSTWHATEADAGGAASIRYLRWTISSIAPAGSQQLTFQVCVSFYAFFDGQKCNNGDGLAGGCSFSNGAWNFANGNNVGSTVSIFGNDPAEPSATADFPTGMNQFSVNNGSWSGATPSHNINVSKGTAYSRDWRFRAV